MKTISKDTIHEVMTRGVAEVVVAESLSQKLTSGKRLRVKLGIDPTSPKLHLGHTVVLRKLRQFQQLGHRVIFLVGDFTARIGDPSGKLSARQPLTEKEIKVNMKSYVKQAARILDINKTEVRYNSEWLKPMDFAELFQLTSYFTVNQMLERDMFQERLKKMKPLWVHELMYPILQGYDSVALRADLELGGTDQTFNVLAARTIQPRYDQEPQDIMTVPLIEGTDGAHKMSKSVGNTIELDDTPQDMFGKVMSLPDSLIIKYFTLLTDVSLKQIGEYVQAMRSGDNPRDFKVLLARELVTMYHSANAATKAAADFSSTFTHKQAPKDIPEKSIKGKDLKTNADMVAFLFSVSKSEARRLIGQNAIECDGVQVVDPNKRPMHGMYKKGRHYMKAVLV
ncbi:MAG: tyrosine--tRNA ligase [Candidatus Kerfeldbacteria bacterium]|nr:tyrosine--tRNA ligase [Candidatus Kerfeldbacteria bacterium]